jgi:chromate transporter
MMLDLFTRGVLISLLAFGGGQAALPLIERLAVGETGWLSPQDFATAVAFGYVTPGPVLITMTFLGYRAAGIAGACVATLGIFLMPWALAAAAAHLLQRWMQHPLLHHFGRGAAPAVVGLLVVTAVHLSRSTFASAIHVGIAGVALGLALWTKLHPLVLLLSGAVIGALYGLVMEGKTL